MQEYEALVNRARAGETDAERRDAFDALVQQFEAAALDWAYALLDDAHLAQDAVQEAFVTAYQNLSQLREPKAFPAWLRRIVRTHCNRQTRGKQVTTRPLDDDADLSSNAHDPAVTVEEGELTHTLLEAVRELPEHERAVTELYYLTGYSQDEIAEQLALPLTTVKKRLQYARERLKEMAPQLRGPHAQLPIAGMPGAELPDNFDDPLDMLRRLIEAGALDADALALLPLSEPTEPASWRPPGVWA